MNVQVLIDTALALVADDKDLLAIDESNSTCNQRFAKPGVPQTGEARRAWRELFDNSIFVSIDQPDSEILN